MALPLIPFVVGAAVGAVATYLAKDEKTRALIAATSLNVSDTVKKGSLKAKDSIVEGSQNLFKRQELEEAGAQDISVEAAETDIEKVSDEEETLEKKSAPKRKTSRKSNRKAKEATENKDAIPVT